jgi:hypothetical protein
VKLAMPLVLGTLWALVASIALYACVRATQYAIYPEPNPATLVWSAHSGYFWRMWIVAYAGGFAGFTAFVIARGSAERVARALLPALGIAAGMIVAQAVVLP